MAALEAASDAELLARTTREPRAFGVFYGRHERAVLAFFLATTRSAELSADLAAETFAQALVSRENFRPGLGQPRAWLFGIARHVLARSLDRRRVEATARHALSLPPLVLDDDAIARIDGLAADDGSVAGLLGELPAEQQRAIEARVIDERAYSDIARELECSEQVVRKRVSRGLAALRARMGGTR